MICEGTGSILFYSLPSLPEVLGGPVQSGGEDSVSSVFKPTVQLVWGHVTAF